MDRMPALMGRHPASREIARLAHLAASHEQAVALAAAIDEYHNGSRAAPDAAGDCFVVRVGGGSDLESIKNQRKLRV